MLAWLASDYLFAVAFAAAGYRLARVPVVPRWVPRLLLWPLGRETRRAIRLHGVSALCTAACLVLLPLVGTGAAALAVGGIAVTWAASAVAWGLGVWLSYQPETGGAPR